MMSNGVEEMRNTHFITKKQDAQDALRHAHFVRTIGGMGIGEKIKAIRIARGLKLADVEEQAGLSDGNLSRVERGKQWLTEEKIYAIARVLGVSPAAFFEDKLAEAEHIRPPGESADLKNSLFLDAKQHEWLALREHLGSDDIAEFTVMIRARQERNVRLYEELENTLHPQRVGKVRATEKEPAGTTGKKQSSQSS